MPNGKDVLNTAICELGVKEQPADSNRVKYNTWYYGKEVSGSAYPWCMAFVQWVYDQAGARLPFKTPSCGALLRWYRENQPECITEDPAPGDIVIFDLPNTSSMTDHTGLFEKYDGQYIVTIDGNTGSTNDANGGAVMRRTRLRRYAIAYIHPREITEKKEEDKPMGEKRYSTLEEIKKDAAWAAPTVEKLMQTLDADGKPIIQGGDKGLDLSVDMLRMLVWMERRISGLRNWPPAAITSAIKFDEKT